MTKLTPKVPSSGLFISHLGHLLPNTWTYLVLYPLPRYGSLRQGSAHQAAAAVSAAEVGQDRHEARDLLALGAGQHWAVSKSWSSFVFKTFFVSLCFFFCIFKLLFFCIFHVSSNLTFFITYISTPVFFLTFFSTHKGVLN